MKDLIAILKKFEKNRQQMKQDTSLLWNEELVAECFMPCAKEILNNGYFRIKGEKGSIILDIGSIELYYHEEEGNIKDYIMYHTNTRKSHSKFNNDNGNFPYFKIGTFNLHQSGIDVTFENEQEKYRASFLIRSYRILDSEEELDSDSVYDAHSTHIFDDIFPNGISFNQEDTTTIEWVTRKPLIEEEPDTLPRINVAEYEQKGEYADHRPRLQKAPGNITNDQYTLLDEETKRQFIKVNANTFYKQDMRLWRFRKRKAQEETK